MKNKPNYLEKIPVKKESINWTTDENGAVTLEIVNKGVFNRIFQVLLKKPKISYIHLEEAGSFIWPLIDGKKDITEIGILMKEYFGDKTEPLYERLAQYFQMLDNCDLIEWIR